MLENLTVPEADNGGEPRKYDRDLTDRQLEFVKHIAAGMNHTDAATLAGYTSAHTQAWRLMQHPRVQQAVKEHRQTRIFGRVGGLALQALEDVLDDKSVSPTAKFPYVKLGLALAGHSEKTPDNKDLHTKDLSEMTPSELEATIAQARQARQAIEARMKDVTPNDAQNDGPVIEAEAEEA